MAKSERLRLEEAIRQAWDVKLTRPTFDAVDAAQARLAVQAMCDFWPDHFVLFTEDRWTTEHSMECRLNGNMASCPYHEAVAKVVEDGPPPPEDLGRWRIIDLDSEGLPSMERSPE